LSVVVDVVCPVAVVVVACTWTWCLATFPAGTGVPLAPAVEGGRGFGVLGVCPCTAK